MLAEKIDHDFKAALKAKDTLKVETIRMLKAALANFLIEKRKLTADETELIGLIRKQIKQREDSIESFKKGGRQELAEKELREKTILESYLPPPFSDQDLEDLVRSVIQATAAQSKGDLGRVIKEALARAQGRADAKRVSQAATKFLSTS